MVCGAMELVRSYKAEPYFDDSWFTKSILLHAFVSNNFTVFMSHPVVELLLLLLLLLS